VGIRKKEKREKRRLMKLTQWPLRHAPVVLRLAGCWLLPNDARSDPQKPQHRFTAID
jgi:hypothetical protein